MAQFNENIKANNIKTLTLGDFRGVDYFNAKNNVANKRATDMRNLIYRNGANHKRNGWKQFANSHEIDTSVTPNVDSFPSINGFWEYKYNNGSGTITTKYIIHSGQKLYEYNKTTGVWTDITPTSTTINDEVSFGVLRGNRLYIFCGTFLVYGTWDNGTTFIVKKVENNAYIPIVATNIEPIGSTTSAQTALESPNKMSKYVKNRLVGANKVELPIYIDGSTYYHSGTYMPNNAAGSIPYVQYAIGAVYDDSTPPNFVRFSEMEVDRNDYVGIKFIISFYPNYSGGDKANYARTFEGLVPLNEINSSSFYSYFREVATGPYADTTLSFSSLLYTKNLQFKIRYDEDTHKYMLYYMFQFYSSYFLTGIDGIATTDFSATLYKSSNDYRLIATNIASISGVKNTDTGVSLSAPSDFTYSDGILSIYTNQSPLIEGQANLEVTIDTGSNSASDINNCTFGIMFGIDEVEYLFASGNDKKPNYDWHSSYRGFSGNGDIPIDEDLTYWSNLDYAVLGSSNQAITGYSYYDDGELAVHKEYSPVDCNLWIRKARYDVAVNNSGVQVYGVNNEVLYKVYFSQFSAAIGEGCVSPHCCVNLKGDKLFLSENGLYGMVIDHNSIQSNSRYARERSRFVNNRLLKEEHLEKAKGIVYDNRLYLAINGNVYIADSRFKTQIDYDDTDDTYTYEWWVWDNVPARFWFILDNKLCFGTQDGRLCIFTNDTYVDEKYDYAYNDDISLSSNKFTYNQTKFGDLTPYDRVEITSNNVYESVCIDVDVDDFDIDYLAYFEGKNFLVDISSSTYYKLYSVDTDAGTFVLKDSSDNVVTWSQISGDDDSIYFQVTGKQMLTDIDTTNHQFRLLREDEKPNAYKYLVKATGNLTAKFYNRVPVSSVWFTPILNFGSNNYLKTISQMTVAPEAVHNGNLVLNWQTRYKEDGLDTNDVLRNFTVQGVQDLDLSAVNFGSFAIETSTFAKSFTSWKKIRKFNYIQFSFISNDDHDCAVHSLEIMYYFMERNRGVR